MLGIDVGLDGPFSRRPSTMGGSVLVESYCDYLWVSMRTYVIFAGLRSLFESYPLSVSSIPPYRSFTCPSLISSCSVEAAIILFTQVIVLLFILISGDHASWPTSSLLILPLQPTHQALCHRTSRWLQDRKPWLHFPSMLFLTTTTTIQSRHSNVSPLRLARIPLP